MSAALLQGSSWQRLPLRTRALWVNIVASALSALVLMAALITYRYVSERDHFLEDTRAFAEMMALALRVPVQQGDAQLGSELLAGVLTRPGMTGAEVVGSNGKAWLTAGNPGTAFTAEASLGVGDARLRVYGEPTGLGGGVLRFALVTLLIGTLTTAAAVFLLWRFQGGIAMPLTRMADLMRRVKKTHDYGLRTGINSPDEIGVFASGLDEMLAQIEAQQLMLKLDLEERTEAERRMDHLAHHDSVTGLPNRNGFNRALSNGLARASRARTKLALLFLDLDNFKIVNDTLGHAAGDALLKGVAERLQSSLRSGDTISRLGGDEFALIMEDVGDSRQVAAIAEKVLHVLTQPFDIDGQNVFVGVSIGVALYPDDADRAQHLLRDADTAMYHAKDAGKGVYRFFSQEMNFAVADRLRRETALRFALSKGELRIVYQPQVRMQGDRVQGFEALIRWQHPDLGVLLPSEFLPIAEEIGLDVQIDEFALRSACRAARAWLDAGMGDFRIAVNVSPRHFSRPELVDEIMRTLGEANVPAEVMEIEITEGAAMHDPKLTEDTIKRLKCRGLTIAMDDFGTGYSSLAYLQRFSIDKLKIDRRFLEDAPAASDKAAILRAILALARALDVEAVAEGVETPEQRRFLVQEGCVSGQGYLWSGPVDPGKAQTMLREGRVSPAIRAD
jgi:diguanylate cyclase (GGDEF)-like protein